MREAELLTAIRYCRGILRSRLQIQNPKSKIEMTANNIQLINIAISLILVVMTFLFIFRIVLTWYPQVESQKLPFSLVVAPTEPFLAPSRKLIPPIGGVDITPIVWVGIVSLIREVLVGQQGIITMLGS